MTRRVIVTGTRLPLSDEDETRLRRMLHKHTMGGTTWVGVGDCMTGVDAWVRGWCKRNASGRWRCFSADWQTYGKRAGPLRNADLVAWASAADEAIAIAMPDPEAHKGTGDTIERCIRAGIAVIVVPRGAKAWA